MPAGDLGALTPERRDLLVRTAAAEFAAAGYRGASLNKIIRACGMSKSSFYYVLTSKEDLFALVVADLTARLGHQLEVPAPREFAGAAFWPSVASLCTQFWTVASTEEAFTHLGRMFYLAQTPEAARDAVATTLSAVRSWLAEVLQVGRAGGAVRDDLPADLQLSMVFALLQTVDAWAVQHAETDEQAGLLDASVRAVRRLLSPDAS